MLQPVVVRQTSTGFQLIAGERRWRAVQRLGWREVPAVVREVNDQTLLTLALIENLQRDDLNPIDEARGYQRLIDEFELAPPDVAKLVGRDRSTVSNTLRLLGLPEEVQDQVVSGALSAGHARALLALPAPDAMVRIGRQAVAQGWSVRETEAQVRNGSPKKRRRGTTGPQPASVEARRVEEALRRRLGTDVRLTAKRRGRGLLSISYYSNDDLARVLELILGQPFEG
jgi:ParB family chromosome partitioning protein